MWEHDFLAHCTAGHKRNFIWRDWISRPLKTVEDTCALCNNMTTFTVERYWHKPAPARDDVPFKD